MILKEKIHTKNIILIGTGGTIAGTGTDGKTSCYTAAQVEIDELVLEAPFINSLSNIESKNMFNIDSSDMSFEKWIELADYINKEAQRDDVNGFVITHGTDTLEETAYFLNLTVKTEKPVILTGAMRPSTALSADGPFNLFQAVGLAKSKEAIGKGVLVVFSDGIYAARDVHKVNTFRTDAFNQKDFGCLGYMRDEAPYFYNTSVKKHTVNSEFDVNTLKERIPKVEILMFYVDADVEILKNTAKFSNGVVLAGAGCGGCNNKWEKKIKELAGENFSIVKSSRIANGLVSCVEEKHTGNEIYANNLSPTKARILLTLALNKTNDSVKLQRIFDEY